MKVKPRVLTYANMAKLFSRGATVPDVADEVGLREEAVYDYVSQLQYLGFVYVSGWEKDCSGNDIRRVFTMGVGEDVPRVLSDSRVKQIARAERKQHEPY